MAEPGDHDDRPGRGRGPEGTEFLDLELSRVLRAEADGLTREAVRDLLREAIRDRLRERLGERLVELARLAADALADDIEVNLDIERRIAARRETRASLDARASEALSRAPAAPTRRSAAKRRGRR